jgi:hypothetical protein
VSLLGLVKDFTREQTSRNKQLPDIIED